jgi:hypothetical protein
MITWTAALSRALFAQGNVGYAKWILSPKANIDGQSVATCSPQIELVATNASSERDLDIMSTFLQNQQATKSRLPNALNPLNTDFISARCSARPTVPKTVG